jgi:hypothetical protein
VTAVFEPSPQDRKPLFMGFFLSECGEHRTAGAHRAWCFDDTEWCYPSSPCRGCELPTLRQQITECHETIAALVAHHTAAHHKCGKGTP